ncbi:pyridoxamine 5'-phosphate oxidase family protein [Pseudooceanicola aestuarii]|uniref:pyridoxamine 5'-phosphate oxidase family protein n=1 Tax=Pseudooceanicola aestuarii TaxID=2697319 RepID=UPI0013D38CC4|nr:pyridoxamine 5'-phosphate oxidase family protein [Pseudooceanicola aestuarii]
MKDFTDTLTTEFWKRLSKVTAGMLHTDADRVVPMAHHGDSGAGVLWFITAQDTDAHEAAAQGKALHYVIAESGAGLYARVQGRLTQSDDRAKLDEIWSPVSAAWFKDGREDDSVRLLKFTPDRAEIWLTDGAAGFLYQVARANITDDTAHAGEHGVITF